MDNTKEAGTAFINFHDTCIDKLVKLSGNKTLQFMDVATLLAFIKLVDSGSKGGDGRQLSIAQMLQIDERYVAGSLMRLIKQGFIIQETNEDTGEQFVRLNPEMFSR